MDKITISNIKPNPGSTSMKDDVNAVLEIEDRKTVFSCIEIGRGEPKFISEGAPLDVESIPLEGQSKEEELIIIEAPTLTSNVSCA